MTTQTNLIPSTWDEALRLFEPALLRAGYAPETVRVRASRLRQLVKLLNIAPVDLVTADVEQWIAQVNARPDSKSAKKDNRMVIRSLCRWLDGVGNLADELAPVRGPVLRIETADRRWQDALALFDTSMTSARLAESTRALRLKHLTRLACDAPAEPWLMTREDLQGWLNRLAKTNSRSTVQAFRVSFRAFYKWAHKTGRIFVDPAEEPTRRAAQLPTPEAWIPELAAFHGYLRALGRSEATIHARLLQLRRFARENASTPPLAITFDDIIDHLAGRQWALETRRNTRNALRSFYAWAEDTGRIDRSPAAKLPIVKSGQPRPRPVQDDEYRLALAKASPRERLMLQLSAELGLRRGEVALVHSKDIVGTVNNWSLVVHGKGNKERTLPLNSNLAGSLRSRGEGYIFPGQLDGHLSAAYVGKIISRLLPKGVTMHALRHRFATRAYNIDRDVFTVQQLLGHASPATTQRYVQVSDTSMRRLVEAVSL